MTDRELLELAAKAAGVFRGADRTDSGINVNGVSFPKWSPLTDDGDALRLAVKLRLNTPLTWPDVSVVASRQWVEKGGEVDWYAATRRAIVRAAAKIGRTM